MPEKRPGKRNIIGTFVIASIAYIILGVFMVVKSQSFADVINVIFGVAMLLYGVINIIAFFVNDLPHENLFMELATGVVAVGLGIFSLVTSKDIAKILFFAIGGVLIIDGMVNIKRAFNLKKIGFSRWNLLLILSAVGIVLGILCVVLYAAREKAVIIFSGISLIFEGIASLITILIDSHQQKKIGMDLARIERDRPID